MRINVLDHGFIKLVDSMPAINPEYQHPEWGDGDERIVAAARVSTGGEVKGREQNQKLLRYLWANKHTSPFEQVRFTFHAKMPIFVARQWIRHRTGSFNEKSARYAEMKDEFYVPTLERMRRQSAFNKQGSGEQLDLETAEQSIAAIRRVSETAYGVYQELLQTGLARELARMVLPVNFYTEWYWTTDLHNLFHFLKLRLDSHAQHEIQVYGYAILDLIQPLCPASVELFKDSIAECAS